MPSQKKILVALRTVTNGILTNTIKSEADIDERVLKSTTKSCKKQLYNLLTAPKSVVHMVDYVAACIKINYGFDDEYITQKDFMKHVRNAIASYDDEGTKAMYRDDVNSIFENFSNMLTEKKREEKTNKKSYSSSYSEPSYSTSYSSSWCESRTRSTGYSRTSC